VSDSPINQIMNPNPVYSHTHTLVDMYPYICSYMCNIRMLCTYMCMCLCIYIYGLYVTTYACVMYVCMHVRMYLYVRMYVMYVCMYLCTPMYVCADLCDLCNPMYVRSQGNVDSFLTFNETSRSCGLNAFVFESSAIQISARTVLTDNLMTFCIPSRQIPG
jgi:hypothetical protein